MSDLRISNEKLLESMRTFIADKTHEHMMDVMQNIRLSYVLVPASFPEGFAKNMVTDAEGKPVALPPGTQFQPCLIKNPKGERYFPIFTDAQQVPKENDYPAIIRIPFLECASLVQTQLELIKGIALNPYTENILFQQELLEAMLTAEKKLKNHVNIPMTKESFQLMARHQVEHVVLPQTLHSDKQKFMDQIEQDAEHLLYTIYCKPYNEEHPAPYTEEDFSIMPLHIADDLDIIRLDLPEKVMAQGICERVYLTINPQTEDTGYFLMEADAQKGKFKLCRIHTDGRYEIVDESPAEGSELESVIQLAREQAAVK